MRSPRATVGVGATSHWTRREFNTRLAKTAVLAAVPGSIAEFWLTATPATAPSEASTGRRLMNIVAHEDDDLLFLSPRLLQAVSAGDAVRTVFLTAGDANNGIAYWSAREEGSQAAYAEMAGVRDLWSHGTERVAGHAVAVYTLVARPAISLVFMRLPDGAPTGTGNSQTGFQSLQKLFTGAIEEIVTVNGAATYTRSDLIATLAALMTAFQPTAIHVQDYVGRFGDGDHSDHHATAYFARLANEEYVTPHDFVGFEDYGTAQRPANVTGTELAAKARAFEAYASYDKYVCRPWSACAGTEIAPWVARQYVVGRVAARSTR